MKTLRYSPGAPPVRIEELNAWLPNEFRAVSRGINAVLDVEVSRAAPETPLKGMIRYASGAPGWDPGAGEGLYVYAGTPPVWTKLH